MATTTMLGTTYQRRRSPAYLLTSQMPSAIRFYVRHSCDEVATMRAPGGSDVVPGAQEVEG